MKISTKKNAYLGVFCPNKHFLQRMPPLIIYLNYMLKTTLLVADKNTYLRIYKCYYRL